jgi:hypothetical protein
VALGKLDVHALPAGGRRRRRDPDAGLPGVTGQGTGIFDDRHDLRLIAADSYDNGLAILRCAIQK